MNSPIYKNVLQSAPALKAGRVGIIPTDTLYGLVACANNPEAVQRLYDLKKREAKPGTLIAASIEQLMELGLKKRYLTAVKQYWPSAVSIVIPTGPLLNHLHQGKYSLACRLPDNKNLQKLLKETGPLLTSSANHPGKQPATTVQEAESYFNDQVDFYVDGGELNGLPSTVIRIVDDAVEVLREGSVKINEETGKVL